MYSYVHIQYVHVYTCTLDVSTHEIEVGDREDSPELLSLPAIHDTLQDEGYALRTVLIKQFDELFSVSFAWQRVHPAFPVRLVAEIFGVHKHHSTP